MARPITLLFAAAMFVNALLLFLVQPMFAKLLLPRFGGSPAVWTTCMLFFQSALLAGYAYSHSVVKLRQPWQQATVHLVVMALPILALPIAIWGAASTSSGPIASLLQLSTVSVGAPFFALATSAPLLQRWFAAADNPAPGTVTTDPYFLYAASNVGSFASLVLYPTVIEPALALSTQTRLWSIGYGAAVALTIVCAIVLVVSGFNRSSPTAVSPLDRETVDVVGWRRRLRWVALAFVPSSLMLAVTAYLSTDVAAVPLLWVIPLALYLITFVVTFSAYMRPFVTLSNRLFPLLLLYLTWLLIGEARLPFASMAASHLVAFFVIAALCHGALAEDRPAPVHLTGFYLSLAVGGALGGVFNSLVAPLLFKSVLEYPLALAAGIGLLSFRPGTSPLLSKTRWWIQPLLAAALTIIALKWPGHGVFTALATWGFILAAVLVCFSISREPRRFGVSVLIMLALYLAIGGRGYVDVAYASRTFFGTYRVIPDPEHKSFTLFHGTTIHGRQNILSGEPLTYYHRESPIAQVFVTRQPGSVTSVGAVGLGTGTLAAYVQPGQRWLFYEIDPEVEHIARDPRYFTHLDRCLTQCEVVIGDARLSLQERSDMHDVIVLDAFSSDSIPIHLLTREAIAIYLSRLNPDGILAIHISNNHLNLRPVVAAAMRDLGLAGRVRYQDTPPDADNGKFGSQWAVLARSETALGALADHKEWQRLQPRQNFAWTDDFSNIWSIIQWRK